MKIRAFHIIVLIGILLIAAFLIIPKLNLDEEEPILYTAEYPKELEDEPGKDRIVLVNAAKQGYKSRIDIARQLIQGFGGSYDDFIDNLPEGMVYIDIDKTFLRQFDFNSYFMSVSLSPDNFSTIPAASLESYVTEQATFDVFDAETSYMSNITLTHSFFSIPVENTENATISISMVTSLDEEIESDFKIKYMLEPSYKNVKVTEIDSEMFEAAYLVKYKERLISGSAKNMERFIFYGCIPLEDAVEYYDFEAGSQNITSANLSSYVKTYKYMVVTIDALYNSFFDDVEYDFPYVFTQEDMIELANNMVVKK